MAEYEAQSSQMNWLQLLHKWQGSLWRINFRQILHWPSGCCCCCCCWAADEAEQELAARVDALEADDSRRRTSAPPGCGAALVGVAEAGAANSADEGGRDEEVGVAEERAEPKLWLVPLPLMDELQIGIGKPSGPIVVLVTAGDGDAWLLKGDFADDT